MGEFFWMRQERVKTMPRGMVREHKRMVRLIRGVTWIGCFGGSLIVLVGLFLLGWHLFDWVAKMLP